MTKLRGHDVEYRNGQYVFADNGNPTATTWQDRPCGYCGLYNTPEGHDGCLGTLPNVMNACCGHGDSNTAYVQFDKESTLRGQEAIEKIEKLKGE
ncbi:hypothetical protein [Oceanobacillus jeddahense]|uniref:hypothetical protein n=1 Tax=Oceanobacillus jeddahense TaxID=1462527 RepID=UPI000595DD1B|nr:hypothetical protein [Oceanobacillus jeddahense]